MEPVPTPHPPLHDLSTTFDLIDRIEQVGALAQKITAELEHSSGLRRTELMVLRELADGPTHVRVIGRAVGMSVDAVRATAGALATAGLAHLTTHPDGGDALVASPDGRAILAQAEALQIRAAQNVLARMDEDQARRIFDGLDRMFADLQLAATAPRRALESAAGF